MSLRKYGALRYGFIAATIAVTNQTFVATPQVITVSVVQATLVQPTAGTPVVLPFQRPVAQRGIRTFGQPVPPSGFAVTLSASTQNVVIANPSATLVAGTATLQATPQVITVSNPSATLGRTIAASPQVVTVSNRSATLVPGASTLTATPQVITVSNPSATFSAAGTTPSLPLVFRRPVFQRGIRAYGPPSLSVTPPLDRSFMADPQVITVSNPTATLQQAGVQTSPIVLKNRFLRGRNSHPQRPLVAVHGAIDELAPTDFTLAATTQVITVSNPTASLSVTSTTPVNPALFTLRKHVTETRTSTRPTSVKRISPLIQSVPGTAQSFTATTQVIVVVNPDATLNRIGGTSDPPILRLRKVVKPTRVYVRTSETRRIARAEQSVASLNQSFAATTQVVCVSNPTATLAAGAKTFTATPQVVTVSVPSAMLGRTLTATPQVVAVSVPTATLLKGTSTLQATPQVVTVSIPTATFRGATTLPSTIFDTTLASRLAVRTLDTSLDNTLASRAPDRTLEVTE